MDNQAFVFGTATALRVQFETELKLNNLIIQSSWIYNGRVQFRHKCQQLPQLKIDLSIDKSIKNQLANFISIGKCLKKNLHIINGRANYILASLVNNRPCEIFQERY